MERRVARWSRGPPALKNVENITEGEAWEGARAWSYHFPAYHEQRRRGQRRGERDLRARGGRARAATWRSSVPGEVNNNLVNVEGV